MTDILGLIGSLGGATAEQLVAKLGLPPGHAGVASALDQASEFAECPSFLSFTVTTHPQPFVDEIFTFTEYFENAGLQGAAGRWCSAGGLGTEPRRK